MRISDWSSDVCSSDLARAGGAVPSGTADPVRGLEQDRSGRRVVARQLAREAAFAPRDVESDAKMVRDRANIGWRAGPIHEGRALSVDIMVMQIGRAHV